MDLNNNQRARVAGVLIVLGMISGFLSIVPSVESDNFFTEVYPNKSQVLTGAIFQFFLIPIYLSFALILYPILRNFSKPLSLGFIGFRFMAGTFQLLGIILLPMFVDLSQEYLKAFPSDTSFYKSTGEFLRTFRDLTNHLGVILPTALGNFLFYWILYKDNLIPSWLSLWGILANGAVMFAGFLILFHLIEVISFAYGLLSIPLVLQEIVLAIWLITKGLNIKTELNTF